MLLKQRSYDLTEGPVRKMLVLFVLPIIADYTPPSGCLSHPGASSREKGVILRDVAVKNMVEAIKKEFV